MKTPLERRPEVPPRAPDGHPAGAYRPAPRLDVLSAALVALALVAGGALRFVARSSLWLDEAQTATTAALPLGDIADALRADGFPPLFYWVLHGWLAVVGDGDAAARALSGVAGVAALAAVWWAGRHLGGTRVAWMATAVLATSPFAIRYSTEVRMYSVLVGGTALGFLLVARALERPRLGRLAAVAAVTAGMLLLHYWTLFLLVVTVVALAARWWLRRDGASWRVLLAVGAGTAALLPWLGTLRYQLEHTGTPWSRGTQPLTAMEKTFSAWGGGAHVDARLLGALLIGLAAWALVRHRRQGTWPLGIVAGGTLALGVALATLTGSAFQPRYTAVVFPLVVLLVAVGLASLPDQRVRTALLGAIVVLGLVGGVRNAVDERSQAGEVADVIADGAASGDVAVFCPDQLGPGVDRLLPDGVRTVVFPTGADAARVDWVDYEERNEAARPGPFARRLLAEADAAGATVWYVWSPNYRTYGRSCEALEQDLEATGRSGARVVPRDRAVPERSWLTRYGPP